MARNTDQDERPSSPWFSKFGGWPKSAEAGLERPVQHSGLAARFPELDPTFYADASDIPPIERPSDPELDRLLAAERTQIQYNGGLRA